MKVAVDGLVAHALLAARDDDAVDVRLSEVVNARVAEDRAKGLGRRARVTNRLLLGPDFELRDVGVECPSEGLRAESRVAHGMSVAWTRVLLKL